MSSRRTAVVGIDKLVCGPEFNSLFGEPRVQACAERIALDGKSFAPVVRASDMTVIAGEDIIAAHCMLDYDVIEVELVDDESLDDEPSTDLSPHGETECGLTEVGEAIVELDPEPTRGEVLAAAERLAASIHTHTPEEWAEMNRAAEANLFASGAWADPDAPPPEAPGQLETLARVEALQAVEGVKQADAVRIVADATGRSEHAVKKAVNRAKRAKDKVDIQCWGRPQPAAWLASASELRRAMTSAANSTRTALSSLSALVDVSVPGIDIADTYQALKERANKLMRARPACVCAWCKNEPALVARCTACSGRGWLGEHAMSLVPKELMPAEAVMDGGRPAFLDRYKAETIVSMLQPVPESAVYEPEQASEEEEPSAGGRW